jgi:hypothetical protein
MSGSAWTFAAERKEMMIYMFENDSTSFTVLEEVLVDFKRVKGGSGESFYILSSSDSVSKTL